MSIAWTLALQMAVAPVEVEVTPIGFDLAKVPAAATGDRVQIGCRSADPSEIVVCGRRRGDDYPMEEMARRYAVKPIVAEAGIGGNTSVRAYGESVEVGAGQISKRAMVGVKLRFR